MVLRLAAVVGALVYPTNSSSSKFSSGRNSVPIESWKICSQNIYEVVLRGIRSGL